MKKYFYILFIFIFLLTKPLFATPPGAIEPRKDNSENNLTIGQQMSQNIEQTKQNIQDCKALLNELRGIHERLQNKLDNLEKYTTEAELKIALLEADDLMLELKNEKDLDTKIKLQELLDAVNKVIKDIRSVKNEIGNN